MKTKQLPPLNEIVKRHRKSLGLTQAEFAAKVGFSSDAVASWDIGRNIIRKTSALKLSIRLGLNFHDGTLAPVSAAEIIQSQLRAYEVKLMRRLGLNPASGGVGKNINLKENPDVATSGGVK